MRLARPTNPAKDYLEQKRRPNRKHLLFAPAVLPDATAEQAYPATSVGVASGAVAPYSFVAIGGLPPGMSLSSNGFLSGTPTIAGSATITVQARDSSTPNQTVNASLPLTILTSGIIPGVVERWLLDEASAGSSPVTRLGSMPTTPSLNPERINLIDSANVPSISIPGGTAANFATSSKYLSTPSTDAAAEPLHNTFVGTGSWSVFFRIYWPSTPSGGAYLLDRNVNSSWSIGVASSPKKIFLTSKAARTGTLTTTTNAVVVASLQEYSVVCGYDAAADKQFCHVIDGAGTLTTAYSSAGIGRRAIFAVGGMNVGGGDRNQAFGGAMRDLWFCKDALTESQFQLLHNSGSPLTFSTSLIIDRDCGAAPFTLLSNTSDFETSSGLASRGGSPKGMYFYRPFPLFQWDSGLAASHGDYLWLHSSDHCITNNNTDAGIWMGFSNSPSTRPASWTQILPGTFTDGTIGCVQLETPHMVYVSGTFYLYGHADDAINAPAGYSNPQETRLWTSTDLVSWTFQGTAIPLHIQSPINLNHSGYAVVYPPNSLPNQTTWYAMHLGSDAFATYYGTPSSTPLTFNTLDDSEELDGWGPFPAGYDVCEFWNNLFSPDGIKVYGIGRAWMPGARGIAIMEMGFENGAWRLPTGNIWPIIYDTALQPLVGYTQDVRAWMDTSTGILHVYRLSGFFRDNGGDERIDYVRLQF